MSSQTVKQRGAAPKSNDTAASPKKALQPTAAEDGPRWLSSNPSKRTGELFFIAYSVIWVVVFGAGIVATEVYHYWNDWGYNLVTLGIALPSFLIPALFPFGADKNLPWYQRFAVKANIWILPFNFVGNWFWTHYFFALLGASYSFPVKWLWNEVPPLCYFLTQVYFQLYFTFSSILIRRFALGYKSRAARWFMIGFLTLSLSYFFAFMETLTIESVPFYSFTDRAKMYSIGSWFYALYFIVGFPFYLQLDEQKSENSSVGYFFIHALAAAQLVFILCDFWRVIVGSIHADLSTNTLPFLLKYFETK